MKFLVTGANGHLGRKVVSALLKKVSAENIVVSVRHPEKAGQLKALGLEVRQGDFQNPASLDQAFSGIDRLLIISTSGDYADEERIRQHKSAVAAAKRAGVHFIAYTSAANAEESTLSLAPVHRATEEVIKQTGISYSFLRNNWYIENELSTIQGILSGAPLVTSAKNGKVGWATRADYAQAAAVVLAGPGHENTIYELSGTPRTYEDLAGIIEEVIHREVPVQKVDDAGYTTLMKNAGVPEALLPMLVSIQRDIREGTLDIESNDFQKLLGRPVTPLSDYIRRVIDEK
ncbi:MAG: SDR family oxidoreductase [Sporolactobacillus sp.]